MRPVRFPTALLLGSLLTACTRAAPPVAPPPAAPPPPPTPALAWTGRPGVVLRPDTGAPVDLVRPSVRLEVVGGDSARLRVRCRVCADSVEGWVARAEVVSEAPTPEQAAGRTLAEFALAVRTAAAHQRVEALIPVMAPDFTWSLVGEQTPAAAATAWQWEELRTLDRVPALLDRGLAPVEAGLWVAPPEHAEGQGYQGPRLGFRRAPSGRWEWVFLLRGGG